MLGDLGWGCRVPHEGRWLDDRRLQPLDDGAADVHPDVDADVCSDVHAVPDADHDRT
ncbi:MAG: hypothetical protein ACTHLJ_15970 [Angustibacter sp.]